MEVKNENSVVVRILRVWESVTPGAIVDRDVLDESYVLDNTPHAANGHFFANKYNAKYEIKLN